VIITVGPASQSSALPLPEISGTSDQTGNVPFGIPTMRGAIVSVDHPAFAPASFETDEKISAGEIRLDRGHRWRGRVLSRSADGESLGGEICAHGEIRGAGGAIATHRWSRCGKVARGSFEIEALPSGLVDIDLQIAGYLPRIETLDPLKTTTLRVERGILLHGIVTDARKRPLAGAVVSAGRARATSDREGRFSIAIDSLPADVEVRMRGFRPWKTNLKRVEQFSVRLDPASTISGVLVSEDGGPLHDVTVEMVRSNAEGGHSTLWTPVDVGEKGEFVVEAPDAGRYAVAFRATGYRAARFADLQIGYAAALPLGLVPLSRGGGFHGTVVDGTNGKPAGGALIEVVPAGALLLQIVGQYSRPAFISGEDGGFTAGGYDIGRYLVTIRRGKFAAVHLLVDVKRTEIVDLGMISLDRGVEIRGRVEAFDRGAVSNVQVRLFDPARETIVPFATTTADADGRFSLARVSPGRYRIEIGGERLLLAQEITVRATEPTIELTLHSTGVRIRGRVTRDGVPVARGTVRLVSELDPATRRGKIIMQRAGETITWGLPQTTFASDVDAEGVFVLSGAPTGLVRLWYTGSSGESVFRSIVVSGEPEQEAVLDLSGHVLEGRIVDATTGAAVTGTVRLFDSNGRALTEVAGAGGMFRVVDLESGAYSIDARAPGYVPTAATNVLVGNESSPIVLKLEQGEPGSIAVTLTRTDGMGINGVPVTLFDAGGALTKSLPTNDSGRRAFDDVAPGKYIVGWSDPLAGAGCSSSVQIDASHTPHVSATLDQGATVVFRCSDHRCAGASIGLLEVYSADGLDMTPLLSGITPAIRLSTDGEISIGRLAPARYQIRLWVADRQWQTDVTVGSDDLTVPFQ
jgi:hypothetical protein